MATSVFLNPSATASNPFDQDLNTTDDVTFDNITSTGRYVASRTITAAGSLGYSGVMQNLALTLTPTANGGSRTASLITNYFTLDNIYNIDNITGLQAEGGYEGTGTATHVSGLVGAGAHYGTGTTADLDAIEASVSHNGGTGSVTSAAGVEVNATSYADAGGGISNLMGLYINSFGNYAGGAVGTARPIWIQTPINSGGGTVATYQAIKIESTNSIGSTTSQAFNYADLIAIDGSGHLVLNTSGGVKIGTATTQKLGFYNATPIVQGASVADASGGATIDAEARTAINTLISRIEALGLIATV